MGMTMVGGVGGGASPVQQVPPTKGGGPEAPVTAPAAQPGAVAGANDGAAAVGTNATGGGGATDAAAGAMAPATEQQVIEALTKLIEVLNMLVQALQAQAAGGGGAGTQAPPADGTQAPAPAPAAPAPGAPAADAAGGGQVQPAEQKKAKSWTVTSTASGHTWQMTPGQGKQLKDDPKFTLTPTYEDGTTGAALEKGVDPETL